MRAVGEIRAAKARKARPPVYDEVLIQVSPATIDRRLAAAREADGFKGRSHTKPGSMLKSQIPIRTWFEWDNTTPGFVEIDLVSHEGGNSFGEFCFPRQRQRRGRVPSRSLHRFVAQSGLMAGLSESCRSVAVR